MGGDHAPDEPVGAARAHATLETPVRLYGPETLLRPLVAGANHITIVDSRPLEAHGEVATAVRRAPESTLVRMMEDVRGGAASAAVSAGTTGAVLAAGLLFLRRVRGVRRPAIAVPLPSASGPTLLLDAGANAEVKVEDLAQFALMGALYARLVLGAERPRVALLNIGEEAEKGTPLYQEAHGLVAAGAGADYAFVGNIEGRDLLTGHADVVVADGFTGNVALKTCEGTARVLLEAIRAAARSNPMAMAGGLLLKPALGGLRRRLDPETYGGALLVGLQGPVVIAHGNAERTGLVNAMRVAEHAVAADVTGRLIDALREGAAA
jgi:glycerol-3-phosphate acyltransferase PlsX